MHETAKTKKWSDVRSRLIPPDQEDAARESARALRDALGLAAMRSDLGVTQVELAARLGKSQGNISELERRNDVYLSSLREYVEGLGGRLQISAVFDDVPEEDRRLIDLTAALERSLEIARGLDRDRESTNKPIRARSSAPSRRRRVEA